MFHGTRTEVTVPESSTARERTWGAESSPGELAAEHPRRQDVGDVLVAGDHVQADAAAVHGGDQRPAASGAGDDRLEQPLEEAGMLHHCREGQGPQHQPDRGEQARHPAAREEGVDLAETPELLDEAGGHRRVAGLDGGGHGPEARVVDEGLDGVPLQERSEDRGEQRGPQDGQERGQLQDREHHEQRQRQQAERRDVERLSRARRGRHRCSRWPSGRPSARARRRRRG